MHHEDPTFDDHNGELDEGDYREEPSASGGGTGDVTFGAPAKQEEPDQGALGPQPTATTTEEESDDTIIHKIIRSHKESTAFDLNEDGVVDIRDLTYLVKQIKRLDLDGDGAVSVTDIEVLLESIYGSGAVARISFSAALAALKVGMRIRRTCWEPGVFVTLETAETRLGYTVDAIIRYTASGEDGVRTADSRVFSFTLDDILACDWVVVGLLWKDGGVCLK